MPFDFSIPLRVADWRDRARADAQDGAPASTTAGPRADG
jgi:hypothetical protein